MVFLNIAWNTPNKSGWSSFSFPLPTTRSVRRPPLRRVRRTPQAPGPPTGARRAPPGPLWCLTGAGAATSAAPGYGLRAVSLARLFWLDALLGKGKQKISLFLQYPKFNTRVQGRSLLSLRFSMVLGLSELLAGFWKEGCLQRMRNSHLNGGSILKKAYGHVVWPWLSTIDRLRLFFHEANDSLVAKRADSLRATSAEQGPWPSRAPERDRLKGLSP